MALGTTKTRNWGKDDQVMALCMATRRAGMAYKVRCGHLYLARTNGVQTLPFNESFAKIVHVRRGRWESQRMWDGSPIATGISERDVVRATIQKVCK